MEDKIKVIKDWLGTGSINIFGIQFSGKDSLGIPLAEALDGKFLSSGDVVRAATTNSDDDIRKAAQISEQGDLTPTEEFRRLIVPSLMDISLTGKPLILGSVGRWIGEEEVVMSALIESHHELKAVIILDMPEEEVWRRWERSKGIRNGGRADDQDIERVKRRIAEYYDKTIPVINKYTELNYTITINASGTVDESYVQAIDKLYELATN